MMTIFPTLLFFVLGCSSGFLIQDFVYNDTTPQYTQTTDQASIRALMKLIINEKLVRIQMEDRLNAAENEISHMQQYNSTVSKELENEKNNVDKLQVEFSNVKAKLDNITNRLDLCLMDNERTNTSDIDLSIYTRIQPELGNITKLYQTIATENKIIENISSGLKTDLNKLTVRFDMLSTENIKRLEKRSTDAKAELDNLTSRLDIMTKVNITDLENTCTVCVDAKTELDNLTSRFDMMTKGNIKHLEKKFTDAKAELDNLTKIFDFMTVRFDMLTTENIKRLEKKSKDTKAEVDNLTSKFDMIMKLNITNLANTCTVCVDAKAELNNLTSRFDMMTKANSTDLENTCTMCVDAKAAFDNVTNRFLVSNQEHNKRDIWTNESIREMNSTLLQYVTDTNQQIGKLSQDSKKGLSVGFSVFNPLHTTGYGPNPLKFSTVVYNDNSDFNIYSGTFVCRHPGLYFFTHTCVRSNTDAGSFCYFYRNRYKISNTAFATAYPSSSNAILQKLAVGDEVYISGCSHPKLLESDTSFTGFLINPDN